MDADPAMVPLPALLDPVLAYLSKQLPSHVYDVLITAFSHLLAMITSVITLAQAMATSKPWDLDAATVIPPLISLLAAYLALLSLYRTTGWIVRTAFAVVKWGAILGLMWNGYAWMTGGNAGIALGNLAFTLLGLNGGGGMGHHASGASARTQSERTRGARPRPWETFEAHQTWQQEQDEADRRDQMNEAERVMEDIVAAGGRVLREAGFTNIWGAVKSVVDRVAQEDVGSGDGNGHGGTRTQPTRRQPPRKAKARANARDQ